MKNKTLVLPAGAGLDWTDFEASLHQKFGVNAVTYDKEGHRRTCGDINFANGLCYLINRHPRGASKICNSILGYMMHAARVKKKYVTEECRAGMYKIVVPIIQQKEIEGFVSVCGRPFMTPNRVHMYYIHEIINENEEKIRKLLHTLVPINPRTIYDIVDYITSYFQDRYLFCI